MAEIVGHAKGELGLSMTSRYAGQETMTAPRGTRNSYSWRMEGCTKSATRRLVRGQGKPYPKRFLHRVLLLRFILVVGDLGLLLAVLETPQRHGLGHFLAFAHEAMEVRLPNGAQVRIEEGVDGEVLRLVLSTLSGL